MKKMIFFTIISIQIGAIIFLYFQIKKKTNQDIKPSSLKNYDPKTIINTPSGRLKYFYEPAAHSTEEVHMDWQPYIAKYTINNDSLNERFNYEIKKNEGVFRIITLGDSFTYGENVDTKDNYSEQLEDLLNAQCKKSKFEVINLGVFGYDIEYMNERYKKRGAKYNPDLVIMLFGDFQLFRLNEKSWDKLNEMRKTHPNMNEFSVYIDSYLKTIAQLGWDAILKWQSTQIEELTHSINCKKLIALLPSFCQYDKYNWITQNKLHIFPCWPFIKYKEIFKSTSINNKSTYFLDDIEWKKRYSSNDGHPNANGHMAIAKDIFAYLREKNLINCKN